MKNKYHKIRFTTDRGRKTWWCVDLKKVGDSYAFFRTKKDGDIWFGNSKHMGVMHAEDIVYIKPATMNKTFCELELSD